MDTGETCIWLIGDTGAVATDGTDPVLQALQTDIQKHPGGAVIFLGDLVYPKGMPLPDHPDRAEAEAVVQAQVDAVKNYAGKVWFLSGNHDWKKGRAGGLKYAKRLEQVISNMIGRSHICLPDKTGPGPECLELIPGFHVIFLNTQWWMQPGKRKTHRAEQFFEALDDMISKMSADKILICGHHPVKSHSLHGGKFRKRHHLFPLSLYGISAAPPLPGIGSLFVLYRKYLGAKEDMSSGRYAWFKEQLTEILEQYPGITYASGHEHNLQWIRRHNINHLISGAGSKTYYVKTGADTEFASNRKGFFRLSINETGIQYITAFEQEFKNGPVVETQTLPWKSPVVK